MISFKAYLNEIRITTSHGYKPRWGQKPTQVKPVGHIHQEPKKDENREADEQKRYQEWLDSLKKKHPNPKYSMDYRKKDEK